MSQIEAGGAGARAEAVIQRMAASLAAVECEAFNRSLVRELTAMLDLDYALVGELAGAGRGVTSLAAWTREGMVPNFSYRVAGTPCERVLTEGCLALPAGLRAAFPDDPVFEELGVEGYVGVPLLARGGEPLGLLSVMNRGPIADVELVTAVLRVFAMRAAAELERKRAEEALRASEERYRRFFDENLCGVCVLRPDLRLTACNPAFAGIFAFDSPRELVGTNLRALVHEPALLDPLLGRLAVAGSLPGLELELTRWDGRPLHLLGNLVAERDGDGVLREVTGYWIDATDRKLAEQQLLHAQRLESIGTLAGGIAHDLNNVLAPVLMSVGLLDDLVEDPRGRRLIASIERSTRRGMDLVRQVLWFARGVEGERQTFILDRLLGEVAKIVTESFPKSIDVVAEGWDDLPAIAGDPTQLYQVLMNLAVNARDAMPGGGSLRIGARAVTVGAERIPAQASHVRPGVHVELTVADTGAGIPAGVRDRIFDPFFTTKEPGLGTGLGLSTAQSIVKSHGGFIEVESSEAEGSVFRVLLPAAPEAVEPELAAAGPQAERGRGELVLVVDDEPTIRDVCSETLEAFGYRALTAADGAEAVAVFARHNGEIAAVVTDLAMPIMDGPAAIRAIRRLNRAVPILAMSGLADRYGLDQIEEHGINVFLEKPFSAEELLTHLGEALATEPFG